MTDADMDWIADLEEETSRKSLPPDEKTQRLAILADHYTSMEEEIAETEAKLKTLNERFRQLREDIIPDLMISFGVKKIILTDGSELGYSNFYAGKILDEKAYDWLEVNGYQDAVKQELKLEVSRTEHVSLERIKEFIAKNPRISENMSIREKQSIHHMTLGSVIKSLTKQGKELPRDLIETFIGNRASLKKGKDRE